MATHDELRWHQRLENFGKVVAQLEAACNKNEYTELERAGLVQMFEFNMELAWKTLKDLLFVEGVETKTPRETIRGAFEAGYLTEEETETLLEALIKRNELSHTYNEKTAQEAERLVKDSYQPVLSALYERLQQKKRYS